MGIDWMAWAGWGLSALLIVLGLAGTVLPALPGPALVLAGIVVGAWIDDFTRAGPVTVAVAAVLAALAWLLDYLAALLGARRAGASPQALTGATIGTVVGLFMGFVGVFVLPFVGAMIGEYLARQDHGRALQVGFGTWIGIMLGIVAKVVLSLVMVGLFVAALIW
ncbi:MAG: DUF456 domain-containing protein [Burkholderiales bacterium]|nr:DUF456 domain-containing protein [Burkholderiales bacterium]